MTQKDDNPLTNSDPVTKADILEVKQSLGKIENWIAGESGIFVRLALLEQGNREHAETRNDFKKLVFPVLQQGLSFTVAAILLLIIVHLFPILSQGIVP